MVRNHQRKQHWRSLSGATTLAIGLGALCLNEEVNAQCTHIDHVMFASDGASSDYFGTSVARDGNRIVVGARFEDQAATNAGSAYVYEKQGDTWLETAKLMPSDGEASDEFGYAVAISGDVIAIGSPQEDENGSAAGAVYLYRYNGSVWQEEQKLTGGDSIAADHFGNAVAVHDSWLLVGSPNHDDPTTDVGTVYYYHYQNALFGWLEDGKLTPSTADSQTHYFGDALAIDGDDLFVGTYGEGSNSGAVYWFERKDNEWIEQQKIINPSDSQWSDFGDSVDASDGWLIVGAPFDDETVVNAGAAYIYRRNGSAYEFEVRLEDEVPVSNTWFAESVAISATAAVVGAPFHSEFLASAGLVFGYQYNGALWALDQRMVTPTTSTSDQVGTAVAMDGNEFVASALFGDDGASSAGSVYGGTVGKFALEIEPNVINTGENTTFRSFCGDPGSPLVFVLLEANGQNLFVPLLFFFFDSNHEFEFSFAPGPNLAGLDLTFGMLKINAFDRAVLSNLATLNIQ